MSDVKPTTGRAGWHLQVLLVHLEAATKMSAVGLVSRRDEG